MIQKLLAEVAAVVAAVAAATVVSRHVCLGISVLREGRDWGVKINSGPDPDECKGC
jgi:hypothetical protein